MTGFPLGAVDGLYERAVTAPGTLDDHDLGRWMEDVAAAMEGRVDTAVARAVRKAARNARRLSRYWAQHDPGRLPEWRNGVDEVLGAAGWRPHLDLARRRLDVDPSPQAFDEVKRWFRAVHFTEWMEGVTFEEWLAQDDE